MIWVLLFVGVAFYHTGSGNGEAYNFQEGVEELTAIKSKKKETEREINK